jgi:AraC-like DNA-binding protein
LRSVSPAALWQRGLPANVDNHRSDGAVCIVNLEEEPSVYYGSAFDLLQVYVPHASLCEFADEHGTRRCETLKWPFGKVDPILKNLGVSLLQAMESPELAGSLYLDHAVLAIHAYIACTYGGMRIEPYAMRGGLTRRQMQRATEILTANLDGRLSLSQVARECQLSVSHFVRAFKQSVGQTPYRWLMERRIETAKDLLQNSRLTQADIALRCGFADQACFIRCFRCKVNATPGEWRRSL